MAPSASGAADSTPRPDSRASSAPSSTRAFSLQARAISLMNSGPFLASRTAAVASASSFSTRIAAASAVKRRRLASARSIASALSLPESSIPRPRPHITFSLNSATGARDGRSYTTRRIELEPMSITPTRPPRVLRSGALSADRSGVRSCAAWTGTRRQPFLSTRVGSAAERLSALPRPLRLGLVMK